MKKRFCRLIAALLSAFFLLILSSLSVFAYNPATAEQLITHKNTGNQREDIVAIALSQVGYEEKPVNDTFYGDWYCLPEQEWCAMFVSWCARQAEVSTDILLPTAWAHPNSFKIPYYPGTEYTPQPGDIFFTDEFTHTGIVWYVEGDFFYCIEGNARYHDYTLPPDPSIDSYHVMTNKRLISAHSFGVPNYEGCDKNHTYVRGHDTAHPHKAYYRCSTCGDKYYTGYTDCASDCSRCFSCGCDSTYAGYYEVLPLDNYLRLRSKHSYSSTLPYYVTIGSVVYVYGIDHNSGWAYIDYYGHKGHIPADYLTPYQAAPTDIPAPTLSKTDLLSSETVSFQWEPVDRAESYRLQLYRDGALYLDQYLSKPLPQLPRGSYEARIRACNRVGQSEAASVSFTVRDYFYLTYANGFQETQTHPIGTPLTLGQDLPIREGYQCIGWTDVSGSNFVKYLPGSTLISLQDLQLYPVWKEKDAQPHSLTLREGFRQTEYYIGDDMNTDGLILDFFYSDGSGIPVTEGFTVEGFDSQTAGEKQLTLSYGGLSTTCTVRVNPLPAGDMNHDRLVNRDDLIILLWHINFPAQFPLTAPADFDGNQTVNRDDLIALLWHINFPAQFPLSVTPSATQGETT